MTASKPTSVPAQGPLGQRAAGTRLWPLIGICPSLYAADSAVTGLGLGVTTLTIIGATGTVAWLIRGRVPTAHHLLTPLLVTAAGIALITEVLQAFAFEAYLAFGAALPLILANGTLAGRWDALASGAATLGASLRLGSGFALALTAIGAVRQWADQLFSQQADFHLASTPAGAFLALAGLAVAANAMARRSGRRQAP